MGFRQSANYIVGFILIVLGFALNFFEPKWVVSVNGLMGGLVGGGLALILVNYIGDRKGEKNMYDESDFSIGEKSAYRSFQATFPVMGFFLAFLAWTDFEPSAGAAVSLLFTLMGVSYSVAVFYYRRGYVE